MFALLFALVFQAAPAIPARHLNAVPDPGHVLARVNGQDLRARDVEALLWSWRGQEVTQEVVNYLMLAQDAAKHGIDVPDAEVEAALEEHLKAMQRSLPQGQSVEDAMKAQGFTRSRLFLRKKAELLVDRVLLKDFSATEYAKVSTIIWKPDSEQAADLTAAIEKAEAAHKRLVGGEAWDKVFAETTKDQNALRSKGLLGWRSLDAFPTSVRAEIGNLQPGGITKPAQTQFGIQIFRLEMHGKDAKDAELATLRGAYLSGMKAAYIERLKAETKIERLWPAEGSP